mmetsp:Transcript_6330/g.15794  ORF Transcript_6330/g.15794 Transcript_6330/m.15794 type:complete len:670 (-) Transcript_6330:230-2239(-)
MSPWAETDALRFCASSRVFLDKLSAMVLVRMPFNKTGTKMRQAHGGCFSWRRKVNQQRRPSLPMAALDDKQCLSSGAPTPAAPAALQSPSTQFVNPELFPMTAMPVHHLMALDRLEPYHVFRERGLTVQVVGFESVAFVSHQWLSHRHPDPQGVQLRALQRVLGKILEGRVLDIMDEDTWAAFSKNAGNSRACNASPTISGLLQAKFYSRDVDVDSFAAEMQRGYIWMDFFSVPQPTDQETQLGLGGHDTTAEDQIKAIHSIPYYIERSSCFFVVAPQSTHAERGIICDLESWRKRGWCRLEECANYLAIDTMAPVVITEQPKVTIGNFEDWWIEVANTRAGAVGCGDFSCCAFNHRQRLPNGQEHVIPCDKKHCLEVLKEMWLTKKAHGEATDNINVKGFVTLCSNSMFVQSMDEPWTGGPILLGSSGLAASIDMIKEALHPIDPIFGCVMQMGIPDVAKALLVANNDPAQFDLLGRTPLHNACIIGNYEVAAMLVSYAGQSLGRDVAAFVNIPNKGSAVTPLMRAAHQGYDEVLELLLQVRAEVTPRRCDSGQTALHQATLSGRTRCAQLLIEARAALDARDNQGRTPLHLAAAGLTLFGSHSGKLETARLLLEAGADAELRDSQGLTVAECAVHDEHQAFLELLHKLDRSASPLNCPPLPTRSMPR